MTSTSGTGGSVHQEEQYAHQRKSGRRSSRLLLLQDAGMPDPKDLDPDVWDRAGSSHPSSSMKFSLLSDAWIPGDGCRTPEGSWPYGCWAMYCSQLPYCFRAPPTTSAEPPAAASGETSGRLLSRGCLSRQLPSTAVPPGGAVLPSIAVSPG